MICENVKYFCSEPLYHIENYYRAVTDKTQTWHCHHKLEISLQRSKKELIELNLYYNRPANELIFMTPQEHYALHHSQPSFRTALKEANSRPETRAKRSAAMKEVSNRPETRAKKSAAMKGSIRINNGVINKTVKPSELDNYLNNGWVRGILKKKEYSL